MPAAGSKGWEEEDIFTSSTLPHGRKWRIGSALFSSHPQGGSFAPLPTGAALMHFASGVEFLLSLVLQSMRDKDSAPTLQGPATYKQDLCYTHVCGA